MKTSNRQFIFAFSAVVLIFSRCASEPKAPPAPVWVTQPARTVDAGYIIYVAQADDRNQEQARFKAESQAYEDLANECSFPPKGARTEDKYDHSTGILHTVYVKIAVDYQSCEEAKQANDPESVRKLANIAMTSQIKSYQTKYESETDLAEDADEDDNGGDETKTDDIKAVLNVRQAPQVVYINNPTQFYIARQQVFYYKQDVILSPPATYPPNAPQTVAFTRNVMAPAEQIQQYQTSHPSVEKSPQTWSTTHNQAHQTFGAKQASRQPRSQARGQRNRGGQHSGRALGGKKRRRKNY